MPRPATPSDDPQRPGAWRRLLRAGLALVAAGALLAGCGTLDEQQRK
jgi:hypothetical protein